MDRLSLDFRVGITLMLVVLAAAVVVLALTDSGGTKTETTVVTKTVADAALRRDVAALRARIARTDRSTSQLQRSVASLVARVGALSAQLDRVRPATIAAARLETRLRTLGVQLQTVSQCLFQVQKEIDDIQGYYNTRAPLHKRVTGACLRILQPRFAGR